MRHRKPLPIHSNLLQQPKQVMESYSTSCRSGYRKKYPQLRKKYEEQQFNHEIHSLLLSIAKQNSAKYPISLRQILLQVSKTLLLDQLQLVFLNCLIKQLSWPLNDQVLDQQWQHMSATKPNSNRENSKIHLFMLICGYSVKLYLNDCGKIYENQLCRLHPNFLSFFYKWAQDHTKPALALNLQILNGTYERMIEKPRKNHVQRYDDLNRKVDILVQSLEIRGDMELQQPNIQIKQQYVDGMHLFMSQHYENTFSIIENTLHDQEREVISIDPLWD